MNTSFDQKMFRSFKSRLTRRQNLKDYHGIIKLWEDFKRFYDYSDQPWPDDWRRWQRAAEDAAFTLQRERRDARWDPPSRYRRVS